MLRLRQAVAYSTFRKCLKDSTTRAMSKLAANDSQEAIVVTDDEKLIVCWHPEVPVSYELTQPFPEAAKSSSNSVLNVSMEDSIKFISKKEHPIITVKKLQKLTFTNKHIWFPQKRPGLRNAMQRIPRKREYM